MKEVTKLLINEFGIKKLKMDMMGYKLERSEDYSYHHLIIAKKDCKRMHMENKGYTFDNGAILNNKSSHPYLHQIGEYDRKLFEEISNEMVLMKNKGYIDRENLLRIKGMLEYFEERYLYVRGNNGNLVIKREYLDRCDLEDKELVKRLEDIKRKRLTRKDSMV